MEYCNHFIGFTLNTRHEEFRTFYMDNYIEDVGVIYHQFDYCPICGEKIDWDLKS